MNDLLPPANAEAPSLPPPLPSTATDNNATVVDGSGAPATVADAATTERVLAASRDAVDQHLSESRHGKRGPDKRPRKPRGSPLPSMGDGQVETLLAPEPLAPVVVDAPAFDEETAKALVDISLDLWKDLRDAVVHTVAMTELGDPAVAKESVEAQKMSEKVEAHYRLGGLLCAKKYSVSTKWAPEVLLGGAFLMSAGQTAMIVKRLKAEGAQRRARAKEQKTQ